MKVGEIEISFIDNPNNPRLFSPRLKSGIHNFYREFLFHSFPFLFVSTTVFSKFFSEIGSIRDDASYLLDVADNFG